uniref:Protein-tyrosine sulfotransferase n=1 Tax=Acrobeloides nanus TaxID=290746 RepID=A0A914E108_9BILA
MTYLPALYESGVTPELMDDAMSAFLSEVIQKHDREEKVLCSKDPTVLMYMERIHQMFPKAKFLLLIRDARATVKSINDLNLWRWGFERNNFTQNFIIWNGMIASMANQCANLGSLCLMVHYERLILDTKSEIQRILNFLRVPFYEKILEHEKYMNRNGDKVQISQSMLSLDQVTHKIYKKKLHSWIGFYPNNVLKQLDKIAPMLKTLGYDTNSTIPSYEKLPIICRDKQTLYNGVEESCEAVKF